VAFAPLLYARLNTTNVQEDTMNTYALKSNIRISSITTRVQRREATRMLAKGRELRKKSRDLAISTGPSPKSKRLQAEGNQFHDQGMGLLDCSNDSRDLRRHQHLAAALLHGKTYLACEAKIDETRTSKPDAKTLATIIRHCLPEEEQKHAEHIASMWLDKGDMRLRAMRDGEVLNLIALNRIDAEIATVNKSLLTAVLLVKTREKYVSRVRLDLEVKEKSLEEAKQQVASMRLRIDDLKFQKEEMREAKANTKAVTDTIDDLFAGEAA